MSLELAIKISASSPIRSNQQRMAAVISDKRGRVLSVGQNSYSKTHPLQAHYASKVGSPLAICLHAEISAISLLAESDKKKVYKISIARTMKNGDTGLASPCPICCEAIKDYGFKVVEYTI